MNLNYKIAIINPYKKDALASTLFDGLLNIQKNNNDLFFHTSSEYDDDLLLNNYILPKDKFIDFARDGADLIFLIWSKEFTDFKLAKKINRWNKTIYIDGSEVGRNLRYDFAIQEKIINGKYKGNGAINKKMLKKCALYFKREKPYIKNIIPLPFGIESRYCKFFNKDRVKDIDFFCVFGQDEYPLMRRYTRKILEDFCKKRNIIYRAKKTKTPEEFYELLSRSKVGISVGGGGYDTFRFWEILGNNCLLLTENIDIYQPDSNELNYKRIWQFNNLYDFQYQLEKIADFLKNDYSKVDLEEEYNDIILKHSSPARVLSILKRADKLIS